MKRLIVHTFVRIASVFLPRTPRRRIRSWYKWNYYEPNRQWWHEIWLRRVGFDACRDAIQNLALGSSHGDYGYLPPADSFNLCGASQDLYTSACIMRSCLKLPRLKRVMLFYSAFSAGSQTEMTVEKERALFYKRIWEVPYRFHDDQHFRPKEAALGRFESEAELPPAEYRGACESRTFPCRGIAASDRVSTHLRENRRGNGQTRYVAEMARMAREAGLQFVVVIPPARSDYLAAMPPFDEVFAELLATLRENHDVSLLSFWADPAFADSDFGDADHLDVKGAEKLTKLIHARLERSQSDILPGVRSITFPVHGDHHGSLIALEKGDDFPFEIRRVYYIYGTDPAVVRGHHAHRHLEQVIVCTSGSCDFIVDDGRQRKTIRLDSPRQGLYLKNPIWREFTNFSPDCVVMVLASEHYNEADYIRDYAEFKKAVSENG